MELRYLPNFDSYVRMTTRELRSAFAVEQLFVQNGVTQMYCDADRAIVGSAAPTQSPLKLLATKKEMAADYFLERRELGIINIGGIGKVKVDGTDFDIEPNDVLYAGKGVKSVEFFTKDEAQPALFYFVSYPAHTAYPVQHLRFRDANRTPLGADDAANKRTIFKYIHAGGIKSCQLVMGMTQLEKGSVWNTMPPHTHQRRTEVYMYFDLSPDAVVLHLMGQPQETRSIILRNHQAVISPSWSIHCGAATQNYSFVWAMGGENQEFGDMDGVPMQELL